MVARNLGVLAVAAAVALLGAAPGAAQEPEAPSSTTSTTLLDVPGTLPDSTSTTGPGDTTTTTVSPDDPAAGGDATPEPVPTDSFDIPARIVPGGGPGGTYADQGSFGAYPGRLVHVSQRTATARAQGTRLALEAAIAHRDGLLARQTQLHADLGTLAVQERQAVRALEDAQVLLEARAAAAYVRGTSPNMAILLTSDNATDYFQRRQLLQAVLDADEDAVGGFEEARAAVDGGQAAAAAELAQVSGAIGAAEQAVAAAVLDADLAGRELAVFLAGSSVVIHGFAFPIAGEAQFGDSFGAPRMTGTEYEHWHEGTDVFAASGTELVACERGVITRMGNNVLGGITLWLRGESGVSYYYAHLVDYAPGVSPGLVVEAGTVLGYVGNTGNALTTPPHLHFEVHPPGLDAVNPYPLLSVARDQLQPEPIRLEPTRADLAAGAATTGP